MNRVSGACVVLVLFLGTLMVRADDKALSRAQQTAVADVTSREALIKDVNRKIWEYAEVGLQERKSAGLLVKTLKQNGFAVKSGVAGMPTAFVASYGKGQPVIGILAEYDALPGMSQKVEPVRAAVRSGQPGHACGHSGLGSGALGAALAVKAAMDRHKIKGTIRLYGTPAEETVIGKVYMLLDGQFDDLDRYALRPGNVHCPWLVEPVAARYRDKRLRRFFRSDAAFALPSI